MLTINLKQGLPDTTGEKPQRVRCTSERDTPDTTNRVAPSKIHHLKKQTGCHRHGVARNKIC
jgi:hypothetical protein